MKRLHRIFAGHHIYPRHISGNDTADEKNRRLATLSGAEPKAYQWLFEGYSEAWATETMGLEKQDAKELFNGIYRKLGVRSAREIVHYYAPRDVRFIQPPGTDNEHDEAKR